MSDVRISQLNASLPLSGNEYVPITQMGNNGKLQTVYTTPADIAAFALRSATAPASAVAEAAVSAPTSDTHILMPVGAVIPFGGAIDNPNNIPAGWLVCDGTAVSKSQYSLLYAVIGDRFGAATDASLFKLPDCRYRVVLGYNNTTSTAVPDFGNWSSTQSLALGTMGGEFNHKITTDEIPSHNHSLNDPGHRHVYAGDDMWPAAGQLAQYGISPAPGYIGYDAKSNGGGAPLWYTSSVTTGISIQTVGGNAYHNNMQPFICMNYLIKY
jgi:microcystin-dependent protein